MKSLSKLSISLEIVVCLVFFKTHTSASETLESLRTACRMYIRLESAQHPPCSRLNDLLKKLKQHCYLVCLRKQFCNSFANVA